MRAVIQRVSTASITIGGNVVASIGRGLFVMVGMGAGDTDDDLSYLVGKIARLRVFEDQEGRMNLSVADVGGSLCVVSQFTLYGDVRRGNRPSFSGAMDIDEARARWPAVERAFRKTGIPCGFGRFQETMSCTIVNDGPVTIVMDSSDRKRPRRSRAG